MRKKRLKRFKIAYRGLPLAYPIVALAVAAVLVGGIYFYTGHIRRQLVAHNRRVLSAYARLWALAATKSVGGAELAIFFEEIIQKSDFPMVLTSVEGEPMLWRNLPIPPTDRSEESRKKVKKIISEMRRVRSPVPIYVGESDKVLGYIFYGESPSAGWLRFAPTGVLILIAGLIIFSYVSYNRLKYYEEQNIWLGMARETAHQLGTPISSLLGWLELLKKELSEAAKKGSFEGLSIDPREIAGHMVEDTHILSIIVNRFGQVGSMPELEKIDIVPIVKDVVKYYRERVPRLWGTIMFLEKYEAVPPAMANEILISWAVENLLKNSMEAAQKTGAVIKVAVRKDIEGKDVQIIISDNGKGITGRNARKIFSPGYTTKKRGWGLGLSLAKRIVEDYHFGKLFLLESKPIERTTFVISIPAISTTAPSPE